MHWKTCVVEVAYQVRYARFFAKGKLIIISKKRAKPKSLFLFSCQNVKIIPSLKNTAFFHDTAFDIIQICDLLCFTNTLTLRIYEIECCYLLHSQFITKNFSYTFFSLIPADSFFITGHSRFKIQKTIMASATFSQHSFIFCPCILLSCHWWTDLWCDSRTPIHGTYLLCINLNMLICSIG